MRFTLHVLLEGDEQPQDSHSYTQQEVVVGRSERADLCLPHPQVSLVHLVIRQGAPGEGEGPYVEDRGSTNGTLLQGRPLPPGRGLPLARGHSLTVGPFVLRRGHAPAPGPAGPLAPQDPGALRRLTHSVLALQPVGDEGGRPYLEVEGGAEAGQRLVLAGDGPRVLGRGAEADLTLSDADASRRHAEVCRREGRVQVRDLGSKNGVLLQGRPVRGWRTLRGGCRLQVGQTTLLFVDGVEAYLEGLQRDPPMAPAPRRRPAWELALGLALGLLVLASLGAMAYLLLS